MVMVHEILEELNLDNRHKTTAAEWLEPLRVDVMFCSGRSPGFLALLSTIGLPLRLRLLV